MAATAPGAPPAGGVSAPAVFGGAAAAPVFGAPAPAVAPSPAPDASGAAVTALLARATASQAALLARILGNVCDSPGDAKLRRLRLGNPKVADALLASGALDGLLAPCFGWAREGDADDAFAAQSEAAARQHAAAMRRATERLLELANKPA